MRFQVWGCSRDERMYEIERNCNEVGTLQRVVEPCMLRPILTSTRTKLCGCGRGTLDRPTWRTQVVDLRPTTNMETDSIKILRA